MMPTDPTATLLIGLIIGAALVFGMFAFMVWSMRQTMGDDVTAIDRKLRVAVRRLLRDPDSAAEAVRQSVGDHLDTLNKLIDDIDGADE